MAVGRSDRFTSCYDEESTQEEIFENDVQPMIDVVFSGVVSTSIIDWFLWGSSVLVDYSRRRLFEILHVPHASIRHVLPLDSVYDFFGCANHVNGSQQSQNPTIRLAFSALSSESCIELPLLASLTHPAFTDRNNICIRCHIVREDTYHAGNKGSAWSHSPSSPSAYPSAIRRHHRITIAHRLFLNRSHAHVANEHSKQSLFAQKEELLELHDDVSVSISYMEIYKDECYDLLVDRDTVRISFFRAFPGFWLTGAFWSHGVWVGRCYALVPLLDRHPNFPSGRTMSDKFL